ncbi:MerR family transcriptional regulator [Microvirga sp. 0TCS3.31]
MDWRDLPHLARTFRLPKLAEMTGISQDRVLQWQKIGAWPVEPLGRGNPRKYDIWDAIRARIIREFSDTGLPIFRKGEELTSALVGVMVYAASSGSGDLSNLPEQIKLYRDPEGEWWIDMFGALAVDDERIGRVVVLIRLRRIALEVGERTEAVITTPG